MQAREQRSGVAIDLTRLNRRTVTAFYSNLVTRPTGRAVRMGVEQQLVELTGVESPCLSILDFSQVRIMDYSCADEIVAKLLLRYASGDRPLEVYFLARGLRDHHLEAVEAVLERHALLLAAESVEGTVKLLGPCTSVERDCWDVLVRRGRVRAADVAASCGLASETILPILDRLLDRRVLVALGAELVCPITLLHHV